jgi:hypothetical protein
VLLFFFGEGGFETLAYLSERPFGVETAQTLALTVTLTGFIAACRWHGIGGALGLAGMAAFYGAQFLAQGDLPGGLFPVFFLPALLALGAWAAQTRTSRNHSPSGTRS